MSNRLKAIQDKVLPILKKYNVKKASLFGSVLRDDFQSSKSDIDVLVDLPDTIHGFDYVALKIDLQEELKKILGRPVDVVEYKLIKPSLKPYILPNQFTIL